MVSQHGLDSAVIPLCKRKGKFLHAQFLKMFPLASLEACPPHGVISAQFTLTNGVTQIMENPKHCISFAGI